MDAMCRRRTAAAVARMQRMLAACLLLALVALLLPRPAHAAGGWFQWLFGDTAAPKIERSVPEPGEPTAEPQAPLTFTATDPLQFGRVLSFLDPASLVVSVDGSERSAETRFEPGGIATIVPWFPARTGTIRFTPATPLAEGERTITVRMSDGAGNGGSIESPLLVDSRPPSVLAQSPSDGATLTALDTPIVIAVEDEGVGIDWSSLTVEVAGHSPSVEMDEDSGRVTLTPQPEWSEGDLSVAVSVSDLLGNAAVVSIPYIVAPDVGLAVAVDVAPDSGPAPLTVNFAPDVTTDTAIQYYRWDFNGDGTIDRSEPIGRDQTFTYNESGTYEATLTVTDARGDEASAKVTVRVGNAPPEVTATAAPSNGAPPLAVSFTAVASDRDGIKSFEWDFEGDAVFDRTTTGGTTEYTYATEGAFQPRVRVTDTLGAATVVAVPSLEVRVVEGAPTVTASASPMSGDAPLTVRFDASASDPGGAAITQWAWDFDGDGTVDYTAADDPATTFDYTATGTFYPRVMVTADDGDTSSDVVRITVDAAFDLGVSTDTIDAQLGESVTVETALGGDTRVSVVIERPSGQRISTLVPWQLRRAGEYSDSWGGTDDGGVPVSEGEYRAVLLYEIDGIEHRLDPGAITGGREYNPTRNRMPNRFAPFAGEPLDITFTLPEASRVTAFVGRYDVDTRLVTFYQRQPLGRGSHTIYWNGTNNDGELIHPPPGDDFLIGLFAFSLPDNAIYVRSGVHVTGLEANPPIYTPTGSDPDGPATSDLAFDLSRAGDVELTIHDADAGAFVDWRLYTDLEKGANTIEWDGRTGDGTFVAPGRYRLGLSGVDERGGRTTTLYTLQRIYY